MRFSLFIIFFLMMQHSNAQLTLWLENFENGCGGGCTSFTGVNGAWSFVNAPGTPAGLCGYGGANGGWSNAWYVSCAENAYAAGNCSTGCGSNETLHMGSTSLGDIGAAYDASWTTCKVAVSPLINTSVAGSNTITLSFDYIGYGEPGWDYAQLLYSINGGTTWTYLANPIPTASCCGACNGQNQGRWTNASYVLPGTCNNIANFRIAINWKNDNNGGNDPSFAINDLKLTYTVTVPVELLYFTGTQEDNHTTLAWATGSESNSAVFNIEKSTDGMHFENFTTVKASGNSSVIKKYHCMDTPAKDGVFYYRIHEVDQDGADQLSETIAVRYAFGAATVHAHGSWQDGVMVLDIYSPSAGVSRLKIRDITGKIVWKQDWQLETGRNIVKINLPEAKGNYLATISDVRESGYSIPLLIPAH